MLFTFILSISLLLLCYIFPLFYALFNMMDYDLICVLFSPDHASGYFYQ